ncbi:MAG: PAS domain S-box protein, partial [Elusimicrobiales bacterium]|nr:PAS domain S-box protein [Elusimicrobiales bacterium]
HSPHQKDFTDDNIRERRIPLDGQDVLADVVRARKPIIIENPDKDPSVNKIFVAEVQTKSFCLVPIMTKQKVLGVIGVDNYYSGKKIMADHLTNLILFANFTALALENASLVTDVKLSQERYRAVLDNSPEAILGLDSSFRITVWNIGAQRLFGDSQEDIVGQFVSKLFDPLIFEIIMREVKAKNFFADLCVAGVNSKGLELEMDVIWAGSEARGDQKEWTVVIRDTSEQRKMQSQLIQAEKLSAVGQLISGVAHELNNPLSVILGYSEMFYKEGKGSVNVPLEDMGLIYENSLRCGDIVNNLLTFVRESHNKKQTVSVTKVVDSAVTLMEYKLRKTDDIVIEKLFEEHIPAVMSDFRQMEQIVVNLIQNACDAMESQSGEKKIVINVYHRENFVFISVADNGPGIS